MVQVYPLVLTALYGLASPIGIFLLLKNRNHPYIKFRDPKFLIIQNVGMLICVIITTLYMSLRPSYSCYLYYFGAIFAYSGFGLPLGIRYWQYCVSFHISRVRATLRVRSNEESTITHSSDTWFVKNRWTASYRFLYTTYGVLFVIFLIPIIPYFFLRDQYEYVEDKRICDVYSGGVIANVIMAILWAILFIALGFLMRGSRDAYHVKTEINYMGLIWALVFLIWIPYSQISTPIVKYLSPSLWMVLGFFASFGMACVFPLVLVYKNPPDTTVETSEKSAQFSWMVEQLQNVRFRNALHDFLKLQFCQENLIFYEAVMDWKLIPLSDEVRTEAAVSIRKNFVEEDAICQVNLGSNIRAQLCKEVVSETSPSPTVFDTALKEVLEMIYSNSFLGFKAHPLYSTV